MENTGPVKYHGFVYEERESFQMARLGVLNFSFLARILFSPGKEGWNKKQSEGNVSICLTNVFLCQSQRLPLQLIHVKREYLQALHKSAVSLEASEGYTWPQEMSHFSDSFKLPSLPASHLVVPHPALNCSQGYGVHPKGECDCLLCRVGKVSLALWKKAQVPQPSAQCLLCRGHC